MATVNKGAVKRKVQAMGYAECNRMMRYVQRHAQRGAMGGRYSRGNKLASSIYKRGPVIAAAGNDGVLVVGTVGSDLSYAASVERGAKIHPIFPKGAPHVFRFGSMRRPLLVFWWRGRHVFTPHVPMAPSTIGRSHPGQQGKRFLRQAMLRAAARYRAKFIPGPGSF